MVVERDDSLFGCDYSSTGGISATGDILLVEGINNAKQSIHNWLLTDKGFYPSIDEEYGSNIREGLGESHVAHNLDAVEVYIKEALFANPRVETIESIGRYVKVNGDVIMRINVILVNGDNETFNLNISEEL